MNCYRILKYLLCIIAAAAVAISCSDRLDIPDRSGRIPERDGNLERNPSSDETRRSMILYCAGYNNLTPYMQTNMTELMKGYIPGGFRYSDQLFVFEHLTAKYGNYYTPNAPYLLKIYRDRNGKVITDTVLTMPETTNSASAETVKEVLEFIRDNYESKEYGLIFSSHSTGWLPERQYGRNRSRSINRDLLEVKSIGAQYYGTSANREEMELKDFADAIPMTLEYIIFDSCLMGGIEVAYELKDVCKHLVFSQSQVLAEGFDYPNLAERLLNTKPSDIIGTACDFFDKYDRLSGLERSATISVVDCSKLERLAGACKGIFSEHMDEILSLKTGDIQKTDVTNWFFDLGDLVHKLSLTEAEKAAFDESMEECILYKAATPEFFEVPITAHSGLSTYLPSVGTDQIRLFYSGFDWNVATGYVSF